MRSILVMSLVLVWCVDQSYVYGTIGDVLSSLPQEVGKAFTVAWESLKEAFKHPTREDYRLRHTPKPKRKPKPKPKPGPSSRSRSTTAPPHTVPTTDAEPTLLDENNKYEIYFQIPMEPTISTNTFSGPLLPILQAPKSPTVAHRKFVFYGPETYDPQEDDYNNR